MIQPLGPSAKMKYSSISSHPLLGVHWVLILLHFTWASSGSLRHGSHCRLERPSAKSPSEGTQAAGGVPPRCIYSELVEATQNWRLKPWLPSEVRLRWCSRGDSCFFPNSLLPLTPLFWELTLYHPAAKPWSHSRFLHFPHQSSD